MGRRGGIDVDPALQDLTNQNVTVTELRIHRVNSRYYLIIDLQEGHVIKAQKTGELGIHGYPTISIQKVEGEQWYLVQNFKIDGGIMKLENLLNLLKTEKLRSNEYHVRNSLMYVYKCAKLVVKACYPNPEDLEQQHSILKSLVHTKDEELYNVFRFASKLFTSEGKAYTASSLSESAAQDVSVTGVVIYTRPLDFLRKSYGGKQKLGPGKHDFLIVHLGNGDRIIAQKLASKNDCTGERDTCSGHGNRPGDTNGKATKGKAGIHIDKFENEVQGENKYEFRFDGKSMKLRIVLYILQSEDLRYHLLSHNCWRYAYRSAKHLIEICCPDSTEKVDSLRELRKKKRLMANRFVHMVLHPRTVKAGRILETCRNQIKTTAQELKFWK